MPEGKRPIERSTSTCRREDNIKIVKEKGLEGVD
jgi:hypothetical protein